MEFQALLTEIAALKPDAVACFFAGGGAAKFIKDYAAAGLKDKIPLYGSGFLTEGVLDAAGPAADGIITTMHYSDSLDTPRNKQFRLEYAKAFRSQPDVYAVQGYDTGLLLVQGANAVKGDLSAKAAVIKAMESATIDSPRGKWTMSKSHNPVQDIYLRRVENKENKVIGVAAKALADSGAGCRMDGLTSVRRCAQRAGGLPPWQALLLHLRPPLPPNPMSLGSTCSGPGFAQLQCSCPGTSPRAKPLSPACTSHCTMPFGHHIGNRLLGAHGLRHLPDPAAQQRRSTACCCSCWRPG